MFIQLLRYIVDDTSTQTQPIKQTVYTKINSRIMHILKLTKCNWVGWEDISKGGGGNWG